MTVPDPAARTQAGDVHGPSLLVDPLAFRWTLPAWGGRPWNEAVIYELHVGTFEADGDFDGVRRHLDHLAKLGVTAIEQIGRAHVCTPVTNAHLVCRLPLEKKTQQ